MCNHLERNSPNNTCCLNLQCEWHGAFMLPGPGWWGKPGVIERDATEQAHCSACGHGKYMSDHLVAGALIVAAQMAVDLND